MEERKTNNNFTTREQSMHLLKIGVPDYSADCYYDKKSFLGDRNQIYVLNEDEYVVNDEYSLPCWSTGRIIEILTICNAFGTLTGIQFVSEQIPFQTVYDELCAGVTQSVLDFSKWEIEKEN